MIALWICRKVMILAPPLYRCRLRIWPPPSGKDHIKTWKKGWCLKKGHQKFWEIDDNFWGKCWNFLGKRLKKVIKKFRQKIGPPVSEVLDPLVVLGLMWKSSEGVQGYRHSSNHWHRLVQNIGGREVWTIGDSWHHRRFRCYIIGYTCKLVAFFLQCRT